MPAITVALSAGGLVTLFVVLISIAVSHTHFQEFNREGLLVGPDCAIASVGLSFHRLLDVVMSHVPLASGRDDFRLALNTLCQPRPAYAKAAEMQHALVVLCRQLSEDASLRSAIFDMGAFFGLFFISIIFLLPALVSRRNILQKVGILQLRVDPHLKVNVNTGPTNKLRKISILDVLLSLGQGVLPLFLTAAASARLFLGN